jgi:MFS family permease
VDHLSWRWVFYVNLPIGVVALAVVVVVLPAVGEFLRVGALTVPATLGAGVLALRLTVHTG